MMCLCMIEIITFRLMVNKENVVAVKAIIGMVIIIVGIVVVMTSHIFDCSIIGVFNELLGR